MRKMLPNPSGTPLSLAAGGSTQVQESYTFNIGGVQGGANGNFNLWNTDIEIIAFVEDRDNNQIMNAAMSTINYIGLDEANLVKANVYPNPANQVLHIELDEQEELSIEIVDLSGKTVLNGNYGLTYGAEVNTADLQAGMYILKMNVNGKFASQRIAITH
jgi:hypothetical protein